MSITKKFSDFICAPVAPSPEVAKIVDLCLLDWASVLYAGRHEPVARLIREQVMHDGGKAESHVSGSKRRLPARAASLINGVTSHALDYDDTHFASLGHPSVTVFPAVIAVADRIGATMQQVKNAALIGADTAIRMGIWLGRNHYRKGFHITGTAGAFGATAGVAHLLKLSKLQTQMALGITSSMASGVKAQFGTMAKPMHAGLAACAGVDAVIWAKAGMIAAKDGVAEPQGFGATHSAEFDDTAFEGLGVKYLLSEISHKFHACCHGTHAMLEALQDLKKAYKLKPENIKILQIFVHPQYLDICNIYEPETALEVKFSYRQLAAMLLYDIPTNCLDSYTDAISLDENIRALRTRVTVQPDPSQSETSAKVVIQTSKGNFLSSDHDFSKPLSIISREQKILSKSESLMGKNHTAKLWSLIKQEQSFQNKIGSLLILP